MVGYLPIADEEVQPGAPLLSSLGVRLRDNPIAIAEGWQDAPNVLRKRVRLFTSSGTWTKPDQIRCVEVWVVGGGGGGGSAGSVGGGYAGGGGGSAVRVIDRDDLPASVTVTVGSGGAGGSVQGTGDAGEAGQNGGTSSFGSLVSATGGVGGGGGEGGSGPGGSPGAGGTGSGGDVNLRGQGGSDVWGGGQGAGPFGGKHNSLSGNATTSQNYGVGGGYRTGTRAEGRNGSAGVVVVIEYLGGEADQ